jgi:membrane protein YdbS with pleckstrin-like domain
MENSITIKPSKWAYVYWYVFRNCLGIFILFAVIFGIIGFITGAWLLIGGVLGVLYLFLVLWSLFVRLVRYQKESYTFSPTKVIETLGGIFSSAQTELIVKNFTHITLRLPWFEYTFFKTGSVLIESAGSSGTEITVQSIKEPEKIYEHVKALMRQNGFRLSYDNLVQQEKPSMIGVVLEIITRVFGTLTGSFIFFGSILAGFMSEVPMDLSASWFYIVIIIIAAFISINLVIWSIVHIFDATRRKYLLYADQIEHRDGFFNREIAFIPIENLSDSQTTQTLVQKILGLYNIVLSCQGTGPEITFKSIPNGGLFDQNIDSLIESKQVHSRTVANSSNESVPKVVGSSLLAEKEIAQVRPAIENEFTTEIRPVIFKTIFVCVLLFIPAIFFLPIAPFVFFIMLIGIINMFVTKYKVNKTSFESQVNFLSTRNVKFACDKVTGVILKQDIVDRILGTCSVKFWSVGTFQDLTFANIKKDDKLIYAILQKIGIDTKTEYFDNSPKFDIATYFKKNIFTLVPLSVFLLIAFVLGLVISLSNESNDVTWMIALFSVLFVVVILCIYLPSALFEYIKATNSKLMFYENFVHFKKGWLATEKYFSKYFDVKDIVTHHYLASDKGSLQFNVAGEHIVYTNQGSSQVNYGNPNMSTQTMGANSQGMIVSNSFKADYIQNLSLQDELVDYILDHNPNLEKIMYVKDNISSFIPEGLIATKPLVMQALVSYSILIILTLPTIIIPALIILWVILSQKEQVILYSQTGL